MNSTIRKPLSIALALVLYCSVAPGGQAMSAEEEQLVSVLRSDASLQDKDAACKRLKQIGSAQSVPALADLLADPQLSHSARYALESLPGPEATDALLGALERTNGLTRAGIILSIGLRREERAVPILGRSLRDSDSNVAEAAATALGDIGGKAAVRRLQRALPKASGEKTRGAILDALLMIGDRMLGEGQNNQALRVFKWISKSEAPGRFQAAAYRGMIAASGERALPLLVAAIQGENRWNRAIALQMAGDIEAPGATRALAELLPGLTPPLQTALIGALQQRGDSAATPALVALLKAGGKPEVRLAAIRALGELGDAAAVACLVEAACSADRDEVKAARQALVDIRQGNITDALLAHLLKGKPAAQREIVRALEGRTAKDALPRLLEVAQNGDVDAGTRKVALKALGPLADPPHFGAMVGFVCDAKTGEERAEAQEAFRSFCRRLEEQGARFDAGPLIERYRKGDTAARAALIPGMVMLVADPVRPLLREALTDQDAEVRMAVMRAASDLRDPQLLPDLLKAAEQTEEPRIQVLAIRGCLNLATGPGTMRPAERIGVLKQLLALAERKEEKWLILAGLAQVADPEALDLAMSLLEDPSVRAEATQSAIQIAQALQEIHPERIRGAMQIVLNQSAEPAVRESAEAILQKIDERIGFMTSWRAAGPYREAGKNCSALFDTIFPPETPGAGQVEWRALPAGTRPGRPFLMDLLQVMEGEQCAAYALTGIYSERARPARLEMGSDDGLKAWLNGTLVHANNYIGPLQVNMDKAEVELQPGWNTLLLKITQNNMGWEFCVRLVGPDGALLEEVRHDAARADAERGASPPLRAAFDPATDVPFRRHQLDAAFRSEGVAVADFNRDGRMDVATGNLLYLAPDWEGQPMLAEPQEYDPEGYSNEFLCFAEDVDGDGWMDLIVVGFPGATTHWMRNPGEAGGAWDKHLAVEKTGNESPDWLDVDGDGSKELLFMSERGAALARPGGEPAKLWPIRVIAGPSDPAPGHGLGVGDINGDGLNDVVCPEGWWEGPAAEADAPWAFHRAKLSDAPAQMCVFDADGDGDADVLSSAAHRYGLWWYEQTADGWKMHEIDHSISQLHALHLADINRDGLIDFVTGKRFWAHRHGDEGLDDPSVLCWFELRRKGGAPLWIRHDIDADSGVGLHAQIVDLNQDGLLDIAVSNKKGVYVFTQEPKAKN